MNTSIYILTPCLNAVTTIDKTIWSIISQEGGVNIHYHIQDGGSNDGTLEKLVEWRIKIASMQDYLPSKVIFSFNSSKDDGMYEAIQAGFCAMNIPSNCIMGWCNADDTIWPGAFSHIDTISRHFPEVDWLSGWSSAFDEAGRFLSVNKDTFFPREILAAGMANGQDWPHLQQESTFWRKRLWDKVGGVNSTLKLAGDWDLWRRFAEHEELFHIDRQLGSFHFRKGQKSSDIFNYWGECARLMPMNDRKSAYRLQVKQSPAVQVSRISITEGGGLTTKTESTPISFLWDNFLCLTLSSKRYFRNLRKRRRLTVVTLNS